MWRYIVISFLAAVILISNFGCKRELPHPPMEFDTNIFMWVRDSSNRNLLDSTTTGYFKESEIRVYYLVNGVIIDPFNPSLGHPHMFLIAKNTGNGEYFIVLNPNYGKYFDASERTDVQDTTLIEWHAGDVDTVECTMTHIWSSIYCTKIMYNGVLKYDDKTDKDVVWGDGIFHRFIQVTE
jgi:hypothetical protein